MDITAASGSRGGAMDDGSVKEWLGRTRQDGDTVSLHAIQRLAATLDQDPWPYQAGSVVPESWYAVLFAQVAPQSSLGADGHPQTGDFLPPLAGTRRMFAGRRSRFHRPLHIGDVVTRLSTVTRAETKTGRTGVFTLVTVRHEISGPAGLAVTEEQDLVYRAAVAAGSASPQKLAIAAPLTPHWSKPVMLDPVMVFRYSAVTFNAHRIHYDLPYARDVEGYPALVMNGGLTALLLIEAARKQLGPIAFYEARAVSPLYVGSQVTLNGRMDGDTAILWAADPSGGMAYRVDIELMGQGR
jgi:3-methylfumaryl-CoA hydratase